MPKWKPPTIRLHPTAESREAEAAYTPVVTPEFYNNKNVTVTPKGADVNVASGEETTHDKSIRYENIISTRQLGAGTSGEVKLGIDTSTKKKYALKHINFSLTVNADKMESIYEKETKRLFQKPHPNLVSTYQAFYTNQTLILIQEYMTLGSLEEVLKHCHLQSTTIPEDIISIITRQVLQGLSQLHEATHQGARSQMHRDLKPGNILLNKTGECKIADFGISVEVATMGQSSWIGTPLYMSPERVTGQKYSTPADIWAVGLIVAEMMGKYPFNKKAPLLDVVQEITGGDILLPGCSETFTSFVRALTKKDPGQRPQAFDALNLPFIKKYEALPPSAVGDWFSSNLELPSTADDDLLALPH
eukprot:TRINITY_DN16770_c0_g1_i1.p1 TRINITY_DN16770_c0_g1~~TRINITY_DN16770_c0_g1_i1.p1  ORF type:complete len:378 (+),score=99.24 TRINITY_DN16770_c0_g1_i1:54-1136(+)